MTLEPDPSADVAEAAPRPPAHPESVGGRLAGADEPPQRLAATESAQQRNLLKALTDIVSSKSAQEPTSTLPGFTGAGESALAAEGDTSAESDAPAPTTPPDLQPIEDRPVSANGGVVVGEPSVMNKQPWWNENRVQLSNCGYDRDLEVDHGRVGELAVLALSLRGVKHQYYGGANEDAFSLAHTDAWLIIAVADGVSSAQYSAYASKFIAHSVCRSLRHLLTGNPSPTEATLREFAATAVMTANEHVQRWTINDLGAPDVDSNDLTSDERYASLATTLSVAFVPIASDNGERTVRLATIGDSPTYTLRGRSWRLHTEATKEGAILDNSTRALPTRAGEDVALDWWRINLSADETLLMMTDGIGTSLGRGSGQVGEWLATELSVPCTIDNAIRAVRFDRRGEDDDRTLVVVWGPEVAKAQR